MMVSKSSSTTLNRLWIAITVLVAAIGAVLLVLYLLAALEWENRPFPGALLTPLLTVDESQPLAEISWPGLDAGLRPLDRVVAMNGEALYAPANVGEIDYSAARANFDRILASLKAGDRLVVDYQREDAAACNQTGTLAACQVSYTLGQFHSGDFVGYFVLPYMTALVSLIIGLIVLILRPNQAAARLLSIIAVTLAVLLAGLFDLHTSYRLIPFWLAATAVLGGALATFGLTFPAHGFALSRFPLAEYLPLGIAAVAMGVFLWLYNLPPSPLFRISLYPTLVAVLGLFIMELAMLRQRRFAHSAIIRDQSNTILIGLFLSSIPILIWLVNALVQLLTHVPLLAFNEAAATPLLILAPLSVAYAVLQYRFMDTDRVISQGITYGIMLIGLILGYSLLVFGVSLVLMDNAPANNPLLIGAAIFFIAVVFLPVRNFLQRQIDRVYFRQRHNFQQHVEDFTQKITQSRSVQQISDEFREYTGENGRLQQFVHLRARSSDWSLCRHRQPGT